ncbi:ABC transporter permease [Paenibacillus oryzisoli]|uniref:ABC transporter permease n=1 Tax=Paenibacillus oryzisoli TaxID=1850517 RepID=UPI003D2BB77C
MFFLKPFINLWTHRSLIKQFTARDISLRYKGSLLGIIWSFVTPLLMLIIYTYVYSEIFKAKWNVTSSSKLDFALIIFCGIATYNFFGETLSRAPQIIIHHSNYVKKVVFPLEILPITILLASFINFLISFLILFIGLLMFAQFHIGSFLVVVVLVPYFLLIAGLSWFLSALGVYLRDIGQLIGVIIQALMLLSPIFYPKSVIPPTYQYIYTLNPISFVIEEMRNITIFGFSPQWGILACQTAFALAIFVFGYLFFERSRKGFADVL